jgi:FixJ family two-component response regulator
MRELTLGDPRRSADRDADLVKALRRRETGAIEALIEGLSMAEVADALGISVPAAKTRAHRARLWLRKRLSMFMASAGARSRASLGQKLSERR